jgi:nitroreductase
MGPSTSIHIEFDEKPKEFPKNQINGSSLKPITQVLLDRRATSHFKPDPIPEKYLEAILKFAAQAPSGYNIQPWRFIVVRDLENRKKLQQTAFNQAKISEAPVVIIAVGMKEEWKQYFDEVLLEGSHRGLGKPEHVERQKQGALKFLDSLNPALWVNRHVMIAFTTMMLLAEAYGLDTAPMEGFDPIAVKNEFNLPEEAEVVALLAIGFAKDPDKPYPGRFSLEQIVFSEAYGEPWKENELTS